MKKVIRLTESDLNKIVKRVINEDTTNPNFANLANMLEKAMKGGGTDLDTIKLVFDQIKTKEDYLNLKKSFGMRGGQNLETWIGRDIWSGRDWDTYVKPFYEKIGVKISPVNSELQKVSDKVSSMFNESDLNRIVKRVVNEQKSKPFVDVYNSNKITRLIKESAEAMVDDAKEQMNGGDEPDKGIMDKITSCIKKNKLSNLMVLTTGAGAYALGLIAILMGSGVGAPLALMMSGAILIILEGIGINGQSASSEVSTLMKCMGY